MNILSTIIATGIPGFITYVYLSKVGLLKYTKDEKDEKVIVLAIFSVTNMFFTYYVFRIITQVDPLKDITWINLPSLFFIGILVTIIMTNFYSFILKKLYKFYEKSQRSSKKGIRSKKNIYDKILIKEDDTKPFIYIFDFENKFIESGYFYFLDDIDGKSAFGLSNNTEYIEEPPIFKEVIKAFNEEKDTDKKDLIVDFDKKIKVVVFHLN